MPKKQRFIGRCAICGKVIRGKTLLEFEIKLKKHIDTHIKRKRKRQYRKEKAKVYKCVKA